MESDELRTIDSQALKALRVLVEHVFAQCDDVLAPLTYAELAERIDRRTKAGAPWPRGLGRVLGRVTDIVDEAGVALSERTPLLTSIVVASSGANARLPSEGIRGPWPGYERLSHREKLDKVRAEYQRILQFGSRWNAVLVQAGLDPVTKAAASGASAAPRGWGGGESMDHKALKRYVLQHPELFGAPVGCEAQEEFELRSRDVIDVLFRAPGVWVGVEVKSRTSERDHDDYEKGIYQVVKYRAVLEAQSRMDRPDHPPKVVVFLALDCFLPKEHRQVADRLSVRCHEGLLDQRLGAEVQAVLPGATSGTSPQSATGDDRLLAPTASAM